MPAAIPIVAGVAATAAAGSGGALLAGTALGAFLGGPALFGLTTVGGLVAGGIVAGGGLLSGALAPDMAGPRLSAAATGTVSESAGARWNVLGTCRSAGSWLLYDASAENELWQLITIASHEIDSIVEHRLDDEVVTLDGSGWVQTPLKWQDRVQIQVLDGSHAATLSDLTSAFAYWTAAHKGLGLAQVAIRQVAVPASEIGKVYPGPARRLRYSATVKGVADLLDPRDDSTGWSANAALHVLGHLRRATQDGGLGLTNSEIDLASFEAAADLCDENVALAAGGTEKRYRVGGIQSRDDDPRDVLAALLDAMDAMVYLTPAGKVAIRTGFDDAPGADETFDDTHILAATWRRGPSGIERYNRVVARYPSAAHGYQEQTSPPFDATLAAGEARRAYPLALAFVTSGTQAQRLALRRLQLLNAPYHATVSMDMAGLIAVPTGPAKFNGPRSHWTGAMRVQRRTIGEGLASVQLECVAKPANYGAWDETTDEKPISDQPALGATDQILSAPTVTSTEVVPVIVNQGAKGARIKVNYTALAAKEQAEIEIEWSVANANDWEGARRQSASGGTVRTATLDDGETYDVRVRFIGPGGGATDWTVEEDIDVIAYVDPPDAPTGTAANAVGAVLGISATAPDDDDHRRLAFWYSATNDFGTATLAGTRRCDPGATASVSVSPGPGTWYVWATSRNASGLDSTEDGPDSDTTT